uniref:Uncharacterized protein n=1 Tax=Haptolina ericina TaxID=156174 RepID=A0A7S3AF85_9EUKA
MEAAKQGDLRIMQAALEHDPSLIHERGGGIGHSALHWSAARGHAKTLEWLLQQGAPTDLRNHSGSTSLHAAAGNGQLRCAQVLIQHGGRALAELLDLDGQDAAAIAAQRGYNAIAQMLKQLSSPAPPPSTIDADAPAPTLVGAPAPAPVPTSKPAPATLPTNVEASYAEDGDSNGGVRVNGCCNGGFGSEERRPSALPLPASQLAELDLKELNCLSLLLAQLQRAGGRVDEAPYSQAQGSGSAQGGVVAASLALSPWQASCTARLGEVLAAELRRRDLD